MTWKVFLWRRVNQSQLQEKEIPCICGSNLPYSECHEIEFALPVHEKPEPD